MSMGRALSGAPMPAADRGLDVADEGFERYRLEFGRHAGGGIEKCGAGHAAGPAGVS